MKCWAASISVHLSIKICVIDFGVRIQRRLQDMDLVHPGEPPQRARDALHVAENPGLCRTDLHAGREQPSHQTMVTEGALVGDPGYRMEVTDPVRAGLDTISTADAGLA